jgi:DDE superfamily endonuclease
VSIFCADEAFPLRTYIMKPFHRRGLSDREVVFNYRLSRARRMVENAFGMLANRFRIYRAPMFVHPNTARKVVLATTALHNFLTDCKQVEAAEASIDEDENSDDGGDDDNADNRALQPLRAATGGRINRDAKALRDTLSEYFMAAGRVPLQDKVLKKLELVRI